MSNSLARSQLNTYTQSAIDHIQYLSKTIGSRGSCTSDERQAAEYTAEQMQSLGVQDVRLEPYKGAPSTYRPYALTFSIALLGTLGVWLFPGRWMLAFAAVLSALGAWAMLAETDFTNNWARWLLPKGVSQNAVGVIPPTGETKSRVVLCAHVDTHRTPVIYASKTWNTLFNLLVAGSLVSMLVSALAYTLGAVFSWEWVRWIGLAAAAMEIFALVMSLHADFTPYSPGANDNASGVGVILGIAQHLVQKPLDQTKVLLVFTGCEETASYGMVSFLDTHADELGKDTVYIIIDQVGFGHLCFLAADGLIRKHATHPRALELARAAANALPDIITTERVGLAYTDAVPVTKRGLVALTLCALPPPGSDDSIHWHQMTDTLDHVDPQSLENALDFTWQILKDIDAS
jgi:hypothetical protein